MGGNLKRVEMHHCLRGGWTPLDIAVEVCCGRYVEN